MDNVVQLNTEDLDEQVDRLMLDLYNALDQILFRRQETEADYKRFKVLEKTFRQARLRKQSGDAMGEQRMLGQACLVALYYNGEKEYMQ